MSRSFLLETLDARRLMSVVPVLNTNDTGAGSLRAAVDLAVAGDIVDLRSLTGTIRLDSGSIAIDKDMTLLGPGETALTIDSNNAGRQFVINAGITAKISDMTLTNGNTDQSGGSILNRGALELDDVTVSNNKAFLFGGGIYSFGTALTLTNTTIWGNTSQGALEASGGGIYVEGGTVTVNGSTFANNTAVGKSNLGLTSGPASGGAMYLHNTAASTFTNCTFGNNSALGGTGGLLVNNGQAFGGAIYVSTAAATSMAYCTIAYNQAAGGGSLLSLAMSKGGGVYSTGGGTLSLGSSISALNSASTSPDLLVNVFNSLGNNLVGVFSGSQLINGLLGDLIGTSLLPLAPGLTALGDHGGDTMTYGLDPTSPAVNAGGTTAPMLDQRGFGRRDAADIGSFELNANHLPVIATNPGAPIAGATYMQPLAIVDADSDTVIVTSPNLPSWLKIRQIDGVWNLVGKPTELDAGSKSVQLDVFDGYQTVSTSMKLKVGIPGIDLSDSGLLRLNGTEFDDELSVTMLDDDTVRVFRDGFKRNFPLASIKKVQIFGFAGKDTITVDIGKVRASVFAGDDNDKVQTGAGADYIAGGAGDDTLTAGNGNDRIDGDDGRDRVYGEQGNDTLHGNAGRDIIDGGIGRNRLFGDSGDDVFYALNGTRDIIDGGMGNNVGWWGKDDTVTDAVLGK